MEQPHDPLKRLFGLAFEHFWRQQGTSAASLAATAQCDTSYLYLIRSGKRLPNPKISQRLDGALEANGLLVTLGNVIEEEARRAPGRRASPAEAEGSMQRRNLLRHALAALTAGTAATVVGLETIRDGLALALTGEVGSDLNIDDWVEVAWEYGRSYLITAPDVLIADLAADLVDIQQRLEHEIDDRNRRELSRICGQLAGLMAMSLVNVGQLRAARRWWRTARWAADLSGDASTRMWVRSEEAIRALYTGRSPQVTIDLADEALAIGGRAYAGKALAGKAQALAALGKAAEARQVTRTIEPRLTQVPASVAGDEQTVYGWPEYCLRHVESYVHSYLGDTVEADRAQRRALALYPPTERRSRALVQLHQAMCLVTDGHIDEGSRHAERAFAALPQSQRTALVLRVGQQVLQAVPGAERGRSCVAALHEALALPSGQGTA